VSKVKISESKLRKIIKEEYEKIEKDIDLEEEELNEINWAKEAEKTQYDPNVVKRMQAELEDYKNYSEEMSLAMKELEKFLQDIHAFLLKGTQTSNLRTQQSTMQPKSLGGALEEQELGPSPFAKEKPIRKNLPKEASELISLTKKYNEQNKILVTMFKKIRILYNRMKEVQKKTLPQAEKVLSTAPQKHIPKMPYSPAFKPSRASNKPQASIHKESIDKLIDEEIEKLLKENKY